MAELTTIQVQSVIYGNEKESLLKAIGALANAIRVEREECGRLGKVTLRYGDASPEPIFTGEEADALHKKFEPWLDFGCRFFGFNSGSAKGHNLLGADCDSEYMMVMNPDVMVSPRYFIECLKPFASPDTGMVEARQTPIEHQKEYDVETGETSWAATACTIFPKKLFDRLNGFDDETFFLYCDDVDFSWRIRLAGYKVIYQPLAPVFHAKRLSAGGWWVPTKAEMYYSAEAALLLPWKWSRPEITEKLLKQYEEDGPEQCEKAAAEFRKRQAENRLPQPIDPEHRVAQFIDGYYAKNRFIL